MKVVLFPAMMLILSYTFNQAGNVEENNQVIKDEGKKNPFADYHRLIVGTWELDSLNLDGEIYIDTQRVAVFNPDSSFCAVFKKGYVCDYRGAGAFTMYELRNDTIFQYEKDKSDGFVYPKEEFAKIITLTKGRLIYKPIGTEQQQTHYYHRIK